MLLYIDLTADPYNDKVEPMQVKGIEGIPTGTLEKYVIETDDILYNTIPKSIESNNRRVVASCNAWLVLMQRIAWSYMADSYCLL